ncbi:hypothetical protein GCM10010372_82500 [Streptomyces tauricus]|nr:hypothetical protein GCM10010372_82500 [Streptomyces tauricus]
MLRLRHRSTFPRRHEGNARLWGLSTGRRTFTVSYPSPSPSRWFRSSRYRPGSRTRLPGRERRQTAAGGPVSVLRHANDRAAGDTLA